MLRPRPQTKHARRLLIILCLSVAAGSMAHAWGGGPPRSSDDGAGGALQIASHGGGNPHADGGGEPGSRGGSGGDGGDGGGGDVGVGASTGGSQDLTEASRQAAYGPGEDRDGPDGAGFMPNGEDGLMILADYALARGDDGDGANSNDNSDHFPGTPPGGDGTGFPIGGQDGPGQVGASGDGPTPGGFGGGGFGGGGGGGGGGGAGGKGGKGGGATGSTGTGGGAPTGGGGMGPAADPGPSGPNGPSGDGGGKLCVVSALETCGQRPGGPSIPPQLSAPNLPPGGGAGSDAASVASPVPEPTAWLLLTLGFGSLGATLRRRRREVRETFA